MADSVETEAVIIIHGIGEQARHRTLRDFVGRGTERPEFRGLGSFSKFVSGEASTLVEGKASTPSPQIDGNIPDTPGGGVTPTQPPQTAATSSGIATSKDGVQAEPSPLPGRSHEQYYDIRWGAPHSPKRTHVYEYYWAPHYRDTKFADVAAWAFRLNWIKRENMSMPRIAGPRRNSIRWAWFQSAVTIEWLMVIVLTATLLQLILRLDEKYTEWLPPAARNAAVVILACVVAAMPIACLGLALFDIYVVELIPPRKGIGDKLATIALLLLLAATVFAALLWGINWFIGWGTLLATLLITGYSGAYGLQTMIRCIFFTALAWVALSAWYWSGFKLAGWGTTFAVLSTLSPLLLPIITGKIAKGVGDAARYFSTSPGSALEGETIRADAAKLIADIMDYRVHGSSKNAHSEPAYQRLVVVGHSLGSVIAYDAVVSAWRDRFRDLNRNVGGEQHDGSAPPQFDSGQLFEVVNWTNVFYQHDVVGGQLPGAFGIGVNEFSLEGSPWLWDMAFRYPHSSYWKVNKKKYIEKASEKSVNILRCIIAHPRDCRCQEKPEEEQHRPSRWAWIWAFLKRSQNQSDGNHRISDVDPKLAQERKDAGRGHRVNVLNNFTDISVDDPTKKRWIVSDLVTLGCPLAHAEALLASSQEDLRRRVEDRELIPSFRKYIPDSTPDAPTQGPWLRLRRLGRRICSGIARDELQNV